MNVQIKHRITGKVIFECESDSVKSAVEQVAKQGAFLRCADLSGADLSGADLSGADLRGADLIGVLLSDADLSGALLSDADFRGADLRGADLSGALLSDADLSGALLSDAFLRGADLRGAFLSDAFLRGADLRGADLSGAHIGRETIKKTPISILNLRWDVLITDGYMRIGCQRHHHEQWAQFNDDEISEMADGAIEFWKQWHLPLLEMCKQHASN